MLRQLFSLVGSGLLLCGAASAQVTFTVTGTITSVSNGISGYEVDDTITLTYVTGTSGFVFPPDGANYAWVEEDTTDPELFSSVSFTGAGGSWTRPNSSVGAPDSVINISDDFMAGSDFFALTAAADRSDDPNARMGLTVGGEPVYNIVVQGLIAGSPFVYGTTEVSPAAYFSAYTGSYALGDSGSPSYIELFNGNSINFTATNVVISAIPEPATGAILLGALGLGLRRRRSAR